MDTRSEALKKAMLERQLRQNDFGYVAPDVLRAKNRTNASPRNTEPSIQDMDREIDQMYQNVETIPYEEIMRKDSGAAGSPGDFRVDTSKPVYIEELLKRAGEQFGKDKTPILEEKDEQELEEAIQTDTLELTPRQQMILRMMTR